MISFSHPKFVIWSSALISSLLFPLVLTAQCPSQYTVIYNDDSMPMTGGQGTGASGDLRYCLSQIQDCQSQAITGPWTIQFDPSVTKVTLQANLPVINYYSPDTLTILGNGGSSSTIIDGNSLSGTGYRPFFACQGTVNLSNLQIQNALAQGGRGGNGYRDGKTYYGAGGGGLGAGGALFIDRATVNVSNVTMQRNQAIGGSGGSLTLAYGGPGGGGGLGGNGGDGSSDGGPGGGGGCLGNGGLGGNKDGGGGGGAIGSGQDAANGGAGGSGGGGNGGASANSGIGVNGTYGGGGGGGAKRGGTGGFGGGGGGVISANVNSPDGGFGGGGAGAGVGKLAGSGGFGAGGGMDGQGNVAAGGVGSGLNSGRLASYGACGGAGLGGAVFINSEAGGRLNFVSGVFTTKENTTLGGGQGNSYASLGANAGGFNDLFLYTGKSPITLTFQPVSGDMIEIDGSIADDSLSSLPGGRFVAGSGQGASLLLDSADGRGNLVLGGKNTYGGNTSVINGNLIVNGTLPPTTNLILNGGNVTLNNTQGVRSLQNTNTLSGAELTLNKTLILNNNETTSFNGTIVGGGNVIYQGSFQPGVVFNLLGANSYSGGTSILVGTLGINSGASLGTGFVELFNSAVLQLYPEASPFSLSNPFYLNQAATFDITSGGSLTLSGGVQDDYAVGSLVKKGSGTLILLRGAQLPNTYSGTTFIKEGVLQAGNAGAFSPYSMVDLMDAPGTVLDLNGFDNTIGGLSGGGDLSGNVNFGNSGATLTIEGDATTTFNGAISGNGALHVRGGSLTLNGNQTYTGGTVIANAALIVNGSINGLTTVLPGGVLTGTGSVRHVNNSGVVSPGNSIGRLFASGNYTQNKDGVLNIEISPTQGGLLQVAGDAYIDGTLNILIDSGVYTLGQQFVILKANTINGTFDPVQFSSPSLTFSYAYSDPSHLVLTYEGVYFDPPTSYNGIQVGNYLSSIPFRFGSDMDQVVTVLANLIGSEANNKALEQLTPSIFGAFDLVNVNTSSMVARILESRSERMGSIRSSSPCRQDVSKGCLGKDARAWVEPIGYYMTQARIGDQVGFEVTTGGVVAGIDKNLGGMVFGVGGGWAHQHIHWKEGRGHGHANSGYVGLYTNWAVDFFFIEAAVVGSVDTFNAARKIKVTSVTPGYPNIHRTARHEKGGFNFDGHLGLGGDFSISKGILKGVHVQPFISADYTFLFQRGYSEHGAGFLNLKVNQRNQSMVRSEAGLNVSKNISFGTCNYFVPTVWFSAINEVFLSQKNMSAAMQGEASTFSARTYREPIWLASPGLDLAFVSQNGSSFSLRYGAELNRKIATQKLDFRFNYNY